MTALAVALAIGLAVAAGLAAWAVGRWRSLAESAAADRALLRSERDAAANERDRLRTVLDALPMPVWRRGMKDLKLIAVNRAYAQAVEAMPENAVAESREIGARVLGEEGRELAAREGAHHVLNHTTKGYQEEIVRLTGGRGVDVIVELLANVNLGADLKMLAPRGRVVVIGSRGEVTVNPRDLMGRDGAIYGMLLWNMSDEDAVSTHAALAAGLQNGTLRPVVGLELPLAKAPEAHLKVMEPGAYGKIVLVP